MKWEVVKFWVIVLKIEHVRSEAPKTETFDFVLDHTKLV